MAGKPLLLTAESEDKVALQAFQFTPLCWERHAMPESDVPDSPFQSTPPCAGGDLMDIFNIPVDADFNPRPPVRGATLQRLWVYLPPTFQSTPPCAGGDCIPCPLLLPSAAFQSTPPCAGGDLDKFGGGAHKMVFQSTPPCAGGDVPAQVSSYFHY